MGVFDYVTCEYPLPGLDDPKGVLFQTKDTDAMYLDMYYITREGRLIHHKPIKWEDRSPKGATGFRALMGCHTPVEWDDVDTNFDGELNFYGDKRTGELRTIQMSTMTDQFAEEKNEWFEYNATFKNGQLVNIERVKEDA